MFTFISNIYDISAQLNNAPLYYRRFLIVDGVEYWLQYQHMSYRKNVRYILEGVIMGVSAVHLIKKDVNGSFSVYRYNGSLIIDRHLVGNIIDDTIENIIELETNIRDFFQ
jgi:hypothetical protein